LARILATMSEVVLLGDCRSQGCRDWVRAGRPYAQSKPTAALKATGERHGWTVYGYPDKPHLVASRPEDHTPFSGTGWPIPAPRWVGNAVDIMPHGDAPADRSELAGLGRRIIADKDAGVPGTEWIKYLNWTDERGDCWHVSWESGRKVVTRSTDKGHIHVSGRSDTINETPAAWDPWARMHGSTGEDDEDMGASFGPIDIQPEGTVTSLTIPPVQGGLADPRPAWLNFLNDTGQPYGLRIWFALADDGLAYAPFPGTDGGQLVLKSGQRWSVEIPASTAGLSILRQAVADGKAVAPTKDRPAYAGHLTCAIERGAVQR
jgi:hypothetical protein